ncbi:spike base protein, RCAP_Rcc01079 family [Sphingomonas faeni]|uniref:spike base protein, RCAP_Rcc01079 family n=1 Tax=Sphingomonas faeni TaxID=185950 RepID=UPI00334C1C2B
MADNLIPPATDVPIASKDIGGIQFPRNLLTTTNGVDVSADNPFPVEVIGGSAGDASAANQETEIARLTSILASVDSVEALLTALNALVGDTLEVSFQSQPLPTGAATSEAQAAMAATLALTTAALKFAAITPSNTVVVPNAATIKSLYVTVAGNLVIKGSDGTQVTVPVVAGQILPFAPTYVMAATTATVVALL